LRLADKSRLVKLAAPALRLLLDPVKLRRSATERFFKPTTFIKTSERTDEMGGFAKEVPQQARPKNSEIKFFI
jgi:hypothetical protein